MADMRMSCACGNEIVLEDLDIPQLVMFMEMFEAKHAHSDDRAMTAAATPMSSTVISGDMDGDDDSEPA